MKSNQEKATKWTKTDRKIQQIIIDLYKQCKYYDKVYESVKNFYDVQTSQLNCINWMHIDTEWDPFCWYNDITEEWVLLTWSSWPSRRLSFKEAFPMLPWFFKSTRWSYAENLIRSIEKTWYKAQDIQDKYNISNVTIKSRLKYYFLMEVTHVWKVWYLKLFLRFNILYNIALFQYIKENPDSVLAENFKICKELFSLSWE